MFIDCFIVSVDRCLMPYYGNCSHTRECIPNDLGTVCGDCLPGYRDDPDNPDPAGECLAGYLLVLAIAHVEIQVASHKK